MELLLVLAILVVVAAISFPSIEGMYVHIRTKAAADAVRSAWASARAHAMNEAQPYRFAVLPGHGNYRVAPDGQNYWNGEDPEPQDPNNPPLVLKGSLPQGYRFSTGDASEAPTGDSALADDAVTPDMWSRQVTFMPDGTALEDVAVTIESQGSKPVTLYLRGLTGSVTTR
jgi:type II secretory pathway pseudopilin PulG